MCKKPSIGLGFSMLLEASLIVMCLLSESLRKKIQYFPIRLYNQKFAN